MFIQYIRWARDKQISLCFLLWSIHAHSWRPCYHPCFTVEASELPGCLSHLLEPLSMSLRLDLKPGLTSHATACCESLYWTILLVSHHQVQKAMLIYLTSSLHPVTISSSSCSGLWNLSTHTLRGGRFGFLYLRTCVSEQDCVVWEH